MCGCFLTHVTCSPATWCHLCGVTHRAISFANFHETAMADAALGYLIAFLVLLATVKLWHLLRLNPKLHMIAATLHRAWGDINGFLVVMTIMILAYSVCVSHHNHFITVFTAALQSLSVLYSH